MAMQLQRISAALAIAATTKRRCLAFATVAFAALVLVGPAQAEFGIAQWDGAVTANQAGVPFTQAGGHPYASEATLKFNSHLSQGYPHSPTPDAFTKDVLTEIPVGLVANATVLAQCTASQLLSETCPVASQVGLITIEFGSESPAVESLTFPLVNMVPPTGVPARFGFNILHILIVLDGAVRGQGATLHLGVDSRGISESLPLVGVRPVFWGTPADPAHDGDRCPANPDAFFGSTGGSPLCRGAAGSANGPHAAGAPPVPFLTMPSSCTAPGEGLRFGAAIDSWVEPGIQSPDGSRLLSDPAWATATFFTHEPPPTESVQRGSEHCDIVPSDPVMSIQPTSHSAESATGLNVDLKVPSEGLLSPTGIAQSTLKKVSVTLPEGMTVNPSQADGLGACTLAQYEAETATSEPGSECPSTSKIGTVRITTPLLEEPILGNVYIAEQNENPFHSLLAIYVVAQSPRYGIVIKTPGEIRPDERTGQITAIFDNLPQAPFSDFLFSFREGQRSPLVTPPACGHYAADVQFNPWSDPETTIVREPGFDVTQGVGGGSCPAGGVPPFAPQVISGTQNNAAGSYSPFYLRILRNDGEQEITKFTTVLPPGLTGNLNGIPFCSDAQIEAARVATGTRENGEPSCPAASEIGHSLVGAGVGSVLAFTPGRVYLAGPYHGSALSIVSVTSATVGPFDLGTVVIRFALRVNPTTAQVEIDSSGSDPIPHIIDGIVVHVRDIHVYVDRPDFTVNPTSCDPMSIADTITGAGADPSNPADQASVSVNSPFQAADCASLRFKPIFKASTTARTSRVNGAALKVKLSYPTAPQGTQANIRSVKVSLPRQLPSRLTTLQQACADRVFNANPAACPAASRVGIAKALTPILPVPLEGPAYFVSHGGREFPDLIIVLQGYGITVDLRGQTFISKAGVTSSTFNTVPDQPVTSFELTLPQGPYSALANNGNPCKTKLAMPTTFTAQNGLTIHQSTKITVTGCPKAKKATTKRKATKHHKKKG
jgi:hypothetical protein